MGKRKVKELPKALKIKHLEQYGVDTALYQLDTPLKDGKLLVNYLIISRPQPISGLYKTTIWLADENERFISTNPAYKFKGKDIKHWLKELGYNLING